MDSSTLCEVSRDKVKPWRIKDTSVIGKPIRPSVMSSDSMNLKTETKGAEKGVLLHQENVSSHKFGVAMAVKLGEYREGTAAIATLVYWSIFLMKQHPFCGC